MANFEIGQMIDGYKVVGILGQGGMGTVYLTYQVSMDRQVALKVLDPALAAKDDKFSKQFIDEARAAGRLNHPNIIGVHDVSNCDIDGVRIFYFSMEIVNGEDFKAILARKEVLPLAEAEDVALKISDALTYAERMGIVHRDIKPENIMITKDGLIKLADLGLALQLDNEPQSATQQEGEKTKVMGTPRYMSPEQCRGKPVDARTDQYLLGGTLFHLMTGHAPYEGLGRKDLMRAQVLNDVPDPAEHCTLPEAWRQLLMRMLAKKPDDRVADAQQLHDAVKAAINGTVFNSGNRGIVRRSQRRSNKNQNILMYAGAAILLAVLVFLLIPRTDTPTPTPQPTQPALSPADLQQQDALLATQNFIRQHAPADESDYQDAAQQLAQHPEFAAKTPSGDALRQAAATLEQQQESQNTQAFDALLHTIDDAVQQRKLGHYKKSRQLLNTLSEQDRALVQEPWNAARRDLTKLIQEKLAYALTTIQQTRDTGTLQQCIKDIKLSSLYSVRAKRIDTAIQQQQQVLKRNNTKNEDKRMRAHATEDQRTWQQMTSELARIRGSTDFTSFINTATAAAQTLHNQQLKNRAQAYADMGQNVTGIEQQLTAYLRKNKPSFVFHKKKVRLLRSENNTYVLLRSSGNKVLYIARDDRDIPIQDILHASLHTQTEQQRLTAIAAYLFYWKHPHFSYCNEPLPNIDDVQGDYQTLPLFAPVDPSTSDAFTVNFASPAQWKHHFVGDDIHYADRALHWKTRKPLTGSINNDTEDTIGFSQVTFTPDLGAAARINCTLRIHPNAFILVGVQRGNKRVRLAFNNSARKIIGTVYSDAHNIARAPHMFLSPQVTKLMSSTIQVTIHTDRYGKVSFLVNGKHLKTLEKKSEKGDKKINKDYTSNIGTSTDSVEPLQFIIQGCRSPGTKTASACELLSLKVTRNP